MYKYIKVNNNKVYRNRRIFVLSIFLILILGIYLLNVHLSTKAYGSEPIVYEEVLVESGDSLWVIAKKFNYKNRDIRLLVDEIIEFNSIEGNYIYPGMKLKIPIA